MINTEDIFAKTYRDKCDIYRRVNSVKDPDTKLTKQTEELVQGNVSCALSQKSGGGISFGGQHGSITRQTVLFTRPAVNIEKGNKVVVTTEFGEKITLWAGKPFTYASSHKETPLLEDEPT